MRKVWVYIALLGCYTCLCLAQPLPLGQWRAYPSFNRIHSIAALPAAWYAAAANGVLAVHANGHIETLTLPLLGSAGISALAAHAPANQLLIGYENGHLDILQGSNIYRYTAIRNHSGISGARTIQHINIKDHIAYLATPFGVVVFDLNQREIRETWRNLGPEGQFLAVYQTAFKGDSIFLATEAGIQGGSLADNLLDFTRWKRFNQGSFNRRFTSLVAFNGFLFTAIEGDGLYRYNGLAWEKLNYLSGSSTYRLFASQQHLYTVAATRLYRTNNNEVTEEITDAPFTDPLTVLETPQGLAIGDKQNGLLFRTSNTWQKILPNGPTQDFMFKLRSYNNRMYALPGGYTAAFLPADNTQPVNTFELHTWNTKADWLSRDVIDVAFAGSKVCVGSFSEGLQVVEGTNAMYFNADNSPITDGRIISLAAHNQAVWIANYNAPQPLHRLNSDNTFTSFSFPIAAARYPLEILTDHAGQVWMRLNPATGGGLLVVHPTTANYVYLNEAAGTGGLPSRRVYAMAIDQNGFIWVGTDAGVAYFPNPEQVFSGNVNAIRPVFEGSFLLRDETVTAILVDAGNRKWFGTPRGLWLMDESLSTQLQYFHSANAPLPSDDIQSLAIDAAGNLLVATGQGIAVYRTDTSEPAEVLSAVKIFPNPVPPTFTGWVGISGLTPGSTVRITNLSGKLIWQATSQGGTAAWNLRDNNGQRPPTGVYLVFAISADGRQSLAGKLVLIN